MNRNELVEVIKAKLSRPADVKAEDYQAVIDEAIAVYSKHRPRILVVDTTGDGTFEYSMPSGFEEEFSAILSIEYPYNTTNQYPIYIDEGRDFSVYRDDTALKLRFLNSTPSAAQTFRMTFTALHTITTSSSTVPSIDTQCLVNLAAALMAEQLAADFENRAPSTYPDATIDLRSKAQEWQTQADRYYTQWNKCMGIEEGGGPEAAVAWTDYDWRLQSGESPLTHPVQRQ